MTSRVLSSVLLLSLSWVLSGCAATPATEPASQSAASTAAPVPELGRRVRIQVEGRGRFREQTTDDLFFYYVVCGPDGTRHAVRQLLLASSDCAAMADATRRKVSRPFSLPYPELVGDGQHVREFEMPEGCRFDYSEGAFFVYRIVDQSRVMVVDPEAEVRIETMAKDGSRWVPLRTATGGSLERAKDPVGWPPAGVQ